MDKSYIVLVKKNKLFDIDWPTTWHSEFCTMFYYAVIAVKNNENKLE